jgi:cytoskeletal protein CcmA (bactofilin family)
VGTIVINGEVRGNVRAKTGVEIRHPGRLIGNVEAPSLIIEQGVIFEGSCKMENFSTRKDSFLAPAEKEKKTADNGEKAKSI